MLQSVVVNLSVREEEPVVALEDVVSVPSVVSRLLTITTTGSLAGRVPSRTVSGTRAPPSAVWSVAVLTTMPGAGGVGLALLPLQAARTTDATTATRMRQGTARSDRGTSVDRTTDSTDTDIMTSPEDGSTDRARTRDGPERGRIVLSLGGGFNRRLLPVVDGRSPGSVDDGDRVDLDARAARQRRDLHGRPRRRVLLEVAAVDLVHLREVGEVGEVDRAAHDVSEAGARAGEDRAEVLHHALGLRGDVARDELARPGVERDLPREPEGARAARLDSLAVGSDRLRCRGGRHGLSHGGFLELRALDGGHAVDPLDGAHHGLELGEVADRDLEVVHGPLARRHRPAARLRDVHAGLAEDVRDLREDAGAVGRDDAERDWTLQVATHVPGDVHPTIRIDPEDLVARGGVDRDAPPAGDVADDGVARHRVAAAAVADEHVVDAADPDAARDRSPRDLAEDLGEPRGGGRVRLRPRLRELVGGEDLAQHLLRRGLAVADGGDQVVRDPVAERVRGLVERAVLVDLVERHAEAAELALGHLAPDLDRPPVLGLADELADPRLSAARLHEGEPVLRRVRVRRGEDLDRVAVLELVAERDELPVHLRPDGVLADLGVDGVREVHRRRAARQALHRPLRREDEDLVREEVHLHGLEELAGVDDVLLELDELAQPSDRLRVLLRERLATLPVAPLLLVRPVRGDAFLGDPVHLQGPDLHLDPLALRADDRRVERLVPVRLRDRDVVLEPPGHRLPQRVDDPERLVALRDARDDDPEPDHVLDLVELHVELAHLPPDRVDVLHAPRHVRALEARLLELGADDVDDLLDEPLLLARDDGDLPAEVRPVLRPQVLEREVLELALDPLDAEPVRERRVDVERLAGDPLLRLGLHRVERPHVVGPVGELDEQDADVLRHRDDHLAEVLGLLLLLGVRGRELGELRDAVDEVRDLRAEQLGDLLLRREGVLDRVVEEPGDDGRFVELQLREDACDLERVDEVRLAGLAELTRVDLRAVDVGLLDEVEVGGGMVGRNPVEDVVQSKQAIQRA